MMGNRKSKQEVVRPRSTVSVKSVTSVRRDSYEEADRYICAPRFYHPKIFVALYNYQARWNDEVSLKKGDLMEVISSGRDRNFLLVRLLVGSRHGQVPVMYVAEKDSLRAQE